MSYDLIIIKAVRSSENIIRNAFEYYVIIDWENNLIDSKNLKF